MIRRIFSASAVRAVYFLAAPLRLFQNGEPNLASTYSLVTFGTACPYRLLSIVGLQPRPRLREGTPRAGHRQGQRRFRFVFLPATRHRFGGLSGKHKVQKRCFPTQRGSECIRGSLMSSATFIDGFLVLHLKSRSSRL